MAVELQDVMLKVNGALDRLLRETETAMVELEKMDDYVAGIKLVGFRGEELGLNPIPVFVETTPKPNIPFYVVASGWKRDGLVAPYGTIGDCLEGVGLKGGQKVLVQYGEFDYQPGDIVMFEDLEGHVMIKEFDHWLTDEIAVLRTRYLDPAKDFEVITIRPLMYGKVLR